VPDTPRQLFAGELLLTLAREGRLVLEPDQADEVVASLEHTLSVVRARLRLLRIQQRLPRQRVSGLPEALAREVVDVAFAELLTPGRLEQAHAELPKYIEAMRCAAGQTPQSRDVPA
jgi:hypothetical protein